MATKAKVAILRTKPETAIDDYERLMHMADVTQAPGPVGDDDPQGQHLLALPVPVGEHARRGSSRAPIVGLRKAGFNDLVCVQNKTVVTNAFKGEDLNKYVPVFEHHEVPMMFNFRERT